jgi:hypothetical protein
MFVYGEGDFHPAEDVERPLAAVNKDFWHILRVSALD